MRLHFLRLSCRLNTEQDSLSGGFLELFAAVLRKQWKVRVAVSKEDEVKRTSSKQDREAKLKKKQTALIDVCHHTACVGHYYDFSLLKHAPELYWVTFTPLRES